MKALTLSLVLGLITSMKVSILHSLLNPNFFLSEVKNTSSSQLLITQTSDIIEKVSPEAELLYDLTFSPVYSELIKELSIKDEKFYIKGYSFLSEPNKFEINPKNEESTILSLFNSLLIKNFAVVYSLQSTSTFPSLLEKAKLKYLIESEVSPNTLKFLLQELKFSEISTIFLALPGKTTLNFFEQLNNIDFSNYIWILSESSDFLEFSIEKKLTKDGILRLSRSFSSNFISETFSFFTNCEFEEFFQCSRSFSPPDWHILNVVEGKYRKVGRCGLTCDFEADVYWPKGVVDIKNYKKSLMVSFEASLQDPQGQSLEFLRPAYQGIELGLAYVNNISSAFSVNATRLDLGGTYFNRSFVNESLEKINWKLGLATIAPPISELAVSFYQEMQSKTIVTPMIGYSNTVSMMSSQLEFPYYSRVCMPDTYVTVILSMMAKYFGWQKLGVLYVDNLFSRTLYNEFKIQSQTYSLTILNEGNNKLPANSKLWKNQEFNSIFESLGKSQARIIVVFCFTNEIETILMKMHELGYSGDEYEYLAVGWLVDDLINPKGKFDPTHLKIIRNSLKGSLMFFPVSFVDDFGASIKEKYEASFKTSPVGYSSFAFDSVLAVFNTLSSLMLSQKDYENPSNFMSSLRSIRFLGTTGPVTFQQGKNDRSPMDHYILNTKKVNNSWEIKKIGIFSPSSLKVFTFYENITWPGQKIPSDDPISYKCPFSPDQVKQDKIGTVVLFIVFLIVLGLVFFSIVSGWNRWKDAENISRTGKKYEMTFTDILNISKIPIEFFQYLGLIPSLPMILTIFKSIGNVVSLDLEAVYKLESSIFWIVYQVVLAFSAFCAFLRVLKVFRISIPYSNVLVSLSSDLFFISTLTSLLNIYLCHERSSYPFLYFDCKTRCWESSHLIYVFFNSVVLVFYCLVMVYLKPFWASGSLEDQNVAISGSHTYLKTFMQVFLICLKKLVWIIGSKAYSLTMLVCISAYLVFNSQKQAFNVEILQLWHVLSYFAVAFVCFFSFICEVTGSYDSPLWLIATLVTWGMILMVGLFIQKMKKMFWPFNGGVVDIILLKFAFQNKKIDWVHRHSNIFHHFWIERGDDGLKDVQDCRAPPNSVNL